MSGSSSFKPLEQSATRATSWHASFVGALNGAAFAIPLSLGSAALVFSRVAPELLASGVFAVMLALTAIQLAAAPSPRPIVFAARFFEATTLAAMMDHVIRQLPVWGVEDTRGVRLAMLCLIGGAAGLFLGVLYLARMDRFTRYIPAPVFAGFSNSIAVALLVSQTHVLLALLENGQEPAPVLSTAAVVLASGLAVRRWRPRWPAAATGLAVGLAMGLAWLAAGHGTVVVSTGGGWSTPLPFTLADFSALAGPGASRWPMAWVIATDAGILGTMIFINTTMTSQQMTHADERRAGGMGAALSTAAMVSIAGTLGSVPVSGSGQSSAAAARSTALNGTVLVLCAAASAAVFLSGVLAWIPLAALCGALLVEAWAIVDRGSVRLARDWARGRAMQANSREDLALIAAVTASAIIFNMVVAIFVGLGFGLFLFAVRNARRPVRHVWTGGQLHSNCARSRAELRLLAEHGAGILVFELERDLFFGATDQLEQELGRGLDKASCAIIDWSRVRHIDSSIAPLVAKLERLAARRGVMIVHAGTDMQAGNVAPVLSQFLPDGRFIPDLDRALEVAETHLVKLHGAGAPGEATTMLEAISLFQGLGDSEVTRLETLMEHKLFSAGEAIVTAGDAADELMLLLHGSASVVVRTQDGRDIRLAGLRRGATIGEIGFLDRAARSATVVASEDVKVAILRRRTYDELCEEDPRLVRQLLANIALDVASRLRHTSRLAIARSGR